MWHPSHVNDPPDSKTYFHVGKDGVTAPSIRSAPDPILPPGESEYIKKAGGRITSVVTLVVDGEGKPQQVWVSKPAGMGFDQEAVAAVKRFRFRPALNKDGRPIAVLVNVEENFKVR